MSNTLVKAFRKWKLIERRLRRKRENRIWKKDAKKSVTEQKCRSGGDA